MQYKAFYLLPRSSYRPNMHSDTIWGAICWGMRMLYGERRLQDFLESYETGQTVGAAQPLAISSAFPYIEKDGEPEQHYLPRPLLLDAYYDDQKEGLKSYIKDKGAEGFEKGKLEARRRKLLKPTPFIELEDLKQGNWSAKGTFSIKPKVQNSPMTHNTIDRLTGSTLTSNNRGQLFHTDERYVYPDPQVDMEREKQRQYKAGIYFLAHPDSDIGTLEAIMRLLEQFGIGGDRSSGKGRFDIKIRDLEIQEHDAPNARMNLSLYHPTEAELIAYDAAPKNSPLQYKTTVRQGWKAASLKKPLLYFQEGSVFPMPDDKGIAGTNTDAGEHEEGHRITQYGIGLMINLNVPTS
ncbi:type III-A CRISPR-associated RAMP protein Csm4 [Phaeodactylibacter xiamenensis]|uniref:type III-A CRISPR-associated RAMP protein Csm4 n=1 Tax=Phaeodactylibacter xiamenensis TaxID=1524460 RepID=UPI0024A9A626|nr:type III-A CRISPR-associated RAMP protein Csm4 [Phaeodactylibacter xiamenensis]